MLKNIALSLLLLWLLWAPAQVKGVAHAAMPVGDIVVSAIDESEPADPLGWQQFGDKTLFSWASKDVHYALSSLPRLKVANEITVTAWRGERVSALALVITGRRLDNAKLAISLSDKDRDADAPSANAQARFVSNVLCDEKRGCGVNDKSTPAYLVPDIIGLDKEMTLAERTTRPVWVSFDVPANARVGESVYTLMLNDKQSDEPIGTLRLKLNVVDRALPEPKDYAFHTDFWQQPYSVSRYYGVERWSQSHFDLLKPYLRLLARGGQKVVTAILFYEPWGEQSNDKFDPMIRTTKLKNGKWKYDYSVFDHYVELCDSCGINAQINCYSMIPWDKSFRYYDQATKRYVDLKTSTDSPEYKALWTPFLKSFANHLRKKGWMEKTCIAMDERGLQDMQRAYSILKEAVPEMRMSLAGSPHAELMDKLYDYSLGFPARFTKEQLMRRKDSGLVSTAYTCCPDITPNIETYNPPADAAYIPLYCVANGFDGYLHWSWMNWTDAPLQDSRFKLFPAGDTYLIYPGPRSSVRWERYIEGVQQAEKYRLLRAEYEKQNQQEALKKLEDALKPFQSGKIDNEHTTARLVKAFERVVNGE